jgi:hypothetical protein
MQQWSAEVDPLRRTMKAHGRRRESNAMSTFETSATVEEDGRVLLAVPFAPGTEVDVTISPKVGAAEEKPARPGAGLCWQGNVLVHEGVGACPSVTELRDERLNRLSEGRAE